MLSAVASLTPFSDFNQSPRNMYQCQVGTIICCRLQMRCYSQDLYWSGFFHETGIKEVNRYGGFIRVRYRANQPTFSSPQNNLTKLAILPGCTNLLPASSKFFETPANANLKTFGATSILFSCCIVSLSKCSASHLFALFKTLLTCVPCGVPGVLCMIDSSGIKVNSSVFLCSLDGKADNGNSSTGTETSRRQQTLQTTGQSWKYHQGVKTRFNFSLKSTMSPAYGKFVLIQNVPWQIPVHCSSVEWLVTTTASELVFSKP